MHREESSRSAINERCCGRVENTLHSCKLTSVIHTTVEEDILYKKYVELQGKVVHKLERTSLSALVQTHLQGTEIIYLIQRARWCFLLRAWLANNVVIELENQVIVKSLVAFL